MKSYRMSYSQALSMQRTKSMLKLLTWKPISFPAPPSPSFVFSGDTQNELSFLVAHQPIDHISRGQFLVSELLENIL